MAASGATKGSLAGDAVPPRASTRLSRVPRRDRKRLLAVVLLGVVAPIGTFLPLALAAWQKHVFVWDRDVSNSIHAYENRTTILDRHLDPFDVVLRSPMQLLGLLVVVAVFAVLLARERRREALFIALGAGGATLLGILLKDLFERPPVEPGGNGYTFPSGHAVRSMGAVATVAVVAWPTRWRWAASVLGTAAVVLIGIAVVYHEWHWASDVLAAWSLAVAWVTCVWLALRRWT
jgi:membrane-associated phospholipid phosphatase